jgi:hypothetical protein
MHVIFLNNDMPYRVTFVVKDINPEDTNLDILYKLSKSNIMCGHFPIINNGGMPFYSALRKWNDADEAYLPKILFLTDINGMSFEEGRTYTCRPQKQNWMHIQDNIEEMILTKEKMYTAFTRSSVFGSEIKRENLISALIEHNLNDYVSLLSMTYKTCDFIQASTMFNNCKYNDISYGLKMGHLLQINIAIYQEAKSILFGNKYIGWLHENRNRNQLFQWKCQEIQQPKNRCFYCYTQALFVDTANKMCCERCLAENYSVGTTCSACMDCELTTNQVVYCDKNKKEHTLCKDCFKSSGSKLKCFSPKCGGIMYNTNNIDYYKILESPFKKTCPMCKEHSELFLHGNCDKIQKIVTCENVNLNEDIVIKKDYAGNWVVNEIIKKDEILPGDWVMSIDNENVSELSETEFIKKYKKIDATTTNVSIVCVRSRDSKLYNLIVRRRDAKIMKYPGIDVPDDTYYYYDVRPDQLPQIYCGKCEKNWCTTCNKKEHDGFACNTIHLVSDVPKAVSDIVGDVAIKKCPKCRVAYIKEDGCNLIHCGECQTPFCHLCFAVVPKKNSPDGGREIQYYHFKNSGSSERKARCPLYDGNQTWHYNEIYEFINANNHNPEIQRLILREFNQNHPKIKLKRNKIHSLKSGCFNKVLNTFLTYC